MALRTPEVVFADAVDEVKGPRNGFSELKRSSTKPSRRKPCTKQRWPKENASWQFSKQKSRRLRQQQFSRGRMDAWTGNGPQSAENMPGCECHFAVCDSPMLRTRRTEELVTPPSGFKCVNLADMSAGLTSTGILACAHWNKQQARAPLCHIRQTTLSSARMCTLQVQAKIPGDHSSNWSRTWLCPIPLGLLAQTPTHPRPDYLLGAPVLQWESVLPGANAVPVRHCRALDTSPRRTF